MDFNDLVQKINSINSAVEKVEVAKTETTNNKSLKNVFEALSGLKPIPVVGKEGSTQSTGSGFVNVTDPALQSLGKTIGDLAAQKKLQIVVPPGTQPAVNTAPKTTAPGTQPAGNTAPATPVAAGAAGTSTPTATKESKLDEKWANDAEVKSTGQYSDKSVAELKSMLSKLHKSGPHDKDSPAAKKQRQINFALRAKGHWKSGKGAATKEKTNEGMPAGVIKEKQKYSQMNDKELAEKLKDKSEDDLKKMAWSHGYGKMSNHYVNRVTKGKQSVKEAELPSSQGIDTLGAALGAGRSATTLEGKKKMKMKKKIKENSDHRITAARLEGRSHALKKHAHSGKNYDDMDQARAYHEGFKEGLDECYGQGVYEGDAMRNMPIVGIVDETPAATVPGMADQALNELSPNLLNRAANVTFHRAQSKYDDSRKFQGKQPQDISNASGDVWTTDSQPKHYAVIKQLMDKGYKFRDAAKAAASRDITYQGMSGAQRRKFIQDMEAKAAEYKSRIAASRAQADKYEAEQERRRNPQDLRKDLPIKLSDDMDEGNALSGAPFYSPAVGDRVKYFRNEYDSPQHGKVIGLGSNGRASIRQDGSDEVHTPHQRFVYKNDEVEEGNAFTAALARTPKGGKFSVGGKTFTDRSNYSSMIDEFAFESWDRELTTLLKESDEKIEEGLSLNVNTGQNSIGGGPSDTVSVTATDDDADKLINFVKSGGLGIFGKQGEEQPGTVDHGGIQVVGDHDGMMGLMKKISGIEDRGSNDYADEEGGCEECGHSPCECNSQEEVAEERCNECGMMEARCGCQDKQVVDEVETPDQMEFKVAEADGEGTIPADEQDAQINAALAAGGDGKGGATNENEEDTEQLDELSPELLGRARDAAVRAEIKARAARNLAGFPGLRQGSAEQYAMDTRAKQIEKFGKAQDTAQGREDTKNTLSSLSPAKQRGFNKPVAEEDNEQLDELSPELLGRAHSAALARHANDVPKPEKLGGVIVNPTLTPAQQHVKHVRLAQAHKFGKAQYAAQGREDTKNTLSSLSPAKQRGFNKPVAEEDNEQLDELSPDLLRRAAEKASGRASWAAGRASRGSEPHANIASQDRNLAKKADAQANAKTGQNIDSSDRYNSYAWDAQSADLNKGQTGGTAVANKPKYNKLGEESTAKKDDHAERAGKKVAKDIEYDEGHKGKDDDRAERAGDKVAKDIEYDDKKDKKLDEWANDARRKGTDAQFEQDIEYMTKIISGGLNKPKSTGQTTVPVIANQVNRTVSGPTTDINESLFGMLVLAGLK